MWRGLLLLATLHLACGEVLHEFLRVEWLFNNDTLKDEYIRTGKYDYKACQISNIAVDSTYSTVNPKIYVTVPKIGATQGIPSGLNFLYKINGKSYLVPYPNWAENEQGNCSALQFPMAIAFDPNTKYLWVLDDGLVGIWSGSPIVKCNAKIVVYNTNDYNKRVLTYEFPEDVVSKSYNFLNDLVLDYVDPENPSGGVKYVYISDSVNYRIVVFDVKNRRSWFIQHDSMNMVNLNVTVHGKDYQMRVGVNGIALTPSFNHVFYAALTDTALYSIPTWVLRQNGTDVAPYVRKVGTLPSNPDGMIFGHNGLYFGGMTEDALYRWETRDDINSQHRPEGRVNASTFTMLAQNWETMQWLDSIDIDTIGQLYFVTERAQKFHNDQIDWHGGEGNNFRVFRLPYDGDGSYLKFAHIRPILG